MGTLAAFGLQFISAALKDNHEAATAIGWIGGAIIGSLLGVQIARADLENRAEVKFKTT